MRLLPVLGTALALAASGLFVAGELDPGKVHFVLFPDAIPAITEPRTVAGNGGFLHSDDLVIGVERNGEAKAYPISILNWHEVADDTVGGEPLAITWCPLCYTAMVFDRNVGDQVLTFKVSGKLFKNNLVMYDVETGSLWSQEARAAIAGPLEGTELRLVPSVLVRWGDWRDLHPGAQTMLPPGTRSYDLDPYAGYGSSPDTLFPVVDPDATLHPKAIVFGVALDRGAQAYPLETLRARPVVNDVVGGEAIVATQHKDMVNVWRATAPPYRWVKRAIVEDARGVAYDMLTGAPLDPASGVPALERVDAFPSFWFSWHDFHPETGVFESQGTPPGTVLPRSLVPAAQITTIAALLVGAYAAYRLVRHGLDWRAEARGEHRGLWRGPWENPRSTAFWGVIGVLAGAFLWSDAWSHPDAVMRGAHQGLSVLLVAAGAGVAALGLWLPRTRVRETSLAPDALAARLHAGLDGHGARFRLDDPGPVGPVRGQARYRVAEPQGVLDVVPAPGGVGGARLYLRADGADSPEALVVAVERWLRPPPFEGAAWAAGQALPAA